MRLKRSIKASCSGLPSLIAGGAHVGVVGPTREGLSQVLRAVVCKQNFVAVPRSDLLRNPYQPLTGDRRVDLDVKYLTVEIIDDIEGESRPAVLQRIGHEIG